MDGRDWALQVKSTAARQKYYARNTDLQISIVDEHLELRPLRSNL